MEQTQQPRHQLQQQPAPAVLYNAAGQVVAITLPSSPSAYQSYKTGQSMFSGVVLVITGVLSIIFNGIGISLNEVFSYGGHGIWCGVMVSALCCHYYCSFTSKHKPVGNCLIYRPTLPLCLLCVQLLNIKAKFGQRRQVRHTLYYMPQLAIRRYQFSARCQIQLFNTISECFAD